MSIPKEPRQQMINMMYLVLTALLAMNVSSEILNAFSTVNQSLLASQVSMTDKNDKTFQMLSSFTDPTEHELVYINMAPEVRQTASELHQQIEEHIQALTDMAGGINEKGKIKREDDLNIAATYFIHEGHGDQLQAMVEEKKNSLLEYVDSEARDSFPIPLHASDPVNDPLNRNWATQQFEGVPVIAAITLLRQMQNDTRTAESNVLNHLLDNIRLTDNKMNEISAQVSSGSSHVLHGETYRAEIFPAAYNSTSVPTVYIGRLDMDKVQGDGQGGFLQCSENPMRTIDKTYEAIGGKVEHAFTSSGNGLRSYEGVIEVKDQRGRSSFYPFREEYKVVQSEAVVSPTFANVLYKGIDNPLSISVPGIQNEDIIASISNGSITQISPGRYSAQLSSTGHAEVFVKARMADGSIRNMGTLNFRVLRTPPPICHINGKRNELVTKAWLKAQPFISAHNPDAIGDFKYEFISAHVLLIKPDGSIFRQPQSSYRVNEEVKELIGKAKDGDVVKLTQIKVRINGNETRTIDPIEFRISG